MFRSKGQIDWVLSPPPLTVIKASCSVHEKVDLSLKIICLSLSLSLSLVLPLGEGSDIPSGDIPRGELSLRQADTPLSNHPLLVTGHVSSHSFSYQLDCPW